MIGIFQDYQYIGYYNDPEKSKEIMKGGWIYTGDLG